MKTFRVVKHCQINLHFIFFPVRVPSALFATRLNFHIKNIHFSKLFFQELEKSFFVVDGAHHQNDNSSREDIINFYGVLKMQERKLLIVRLEREGEKVFGDLFGTTTTASTTMERKIQVSR